MDTTAVHEALEVLARMLRADGADLRVLSVDPGTDRVEVALDLEGVGCLDCVLPPEHLRAVIDDSIGRVVPTEFELVLHDPRSPS